MIWQDIAITIASVVFTVALVPQLVYGFREKRASMQRITSIPTFIGLYVVAFSYFTLELYFSCAITSMAATIWLLFYIQTILYAKK
ncbi:MAG: hypothetical protein Q8Q32_01710 [bacterium]|nr:hypothetical protein [bacterium]